MPLGRPSIARYNAAPRQVAGNSLQLAVPGLASLDKVLCECLPCLCMHEEAFPTVFVHVSRDEKQASRLPFGRQKSRTPNSGTR